MILALKNCHMLLPGRRTAKGDIVIDTVSGAIREVAPGGFGGKAEREIDLSGRLAMPGLINCHCHAPMTLVRGLGGGLPLQRWLTEAIFPVEARMTDEDVRAGAAWCRLMIQTRKLALVKPVLLQSFSAISGLLQTSVKKTDQTFLLLS